MLTLNSQNSRKHGELTKLFYHTSPMIACFFGQILFLLLEKKLIKQSTFHRPDSGYTLTWKPLYADIAQSGELGYTYGIYEFKAMDPEGKPIMGNGTYVSIWKKDQFGNWKLVLDTGNEGLEPNKL